MHLAGRDLDRLTDANGRSTEEGPALRDALSVARRAADDEALAAAARESFRTKPMPTVEPDDDIRAHLNPGERVHALRTRAILNVPGGEHVPGYGGTLYLTSRRLVHLGQVMKSVQLADVVESSLAGDRLLLTLAGGDGVSIDVDRPRLLRAEMAEAARGLRIR
jgi:hypothetical protein